MTIKTVSIYDPKTGMFTGEQFSTNNHEHLLRMIPEGFAAFEGRFDHLSQRVNLATGEIDDYQPPQPSTDHEWNPDARRWVLTAQAQRALVQRQEAQAKIDALERSQHRALREHALGIPGAADRLREIDRKIAALRSEAFAGPAAQ